MTAGGAEKSQQCHKYILQYSIFDPKDLRFEHGSVKLASCPGHHLTLLRSWFECTEIGSFMCSGDWKPCEIVLCVHYCKRAFSFACFLVCFTCKVDLSNTLRSANTDYVYDVTRILLLMSSILTQNDDAAL